MFEFEPIRERDSRRFLDRRIEALVLKLRYRIRSISALLFIGWQIDPLVPGAEQHRALLARIQSFVRHIERDTKLPRKGGEHPPKEIIFGGSRPGGVGALG